MMSAMSVLVETEHLKLDRVILDEANKFYGTAIPIVFLERCLTDYSTLGSQSCMI